MIAHKGIERRASTPSEKLASDEARHYTRNLQIQDHTTDDEDHEVGDDLCQVHLGYVESNSESMSSLTGEEVWSSDLQGSFIEGGPLLLQLGSSFVKALINLFLIR